MSAEERGAWWWLLLYERATLRQRIAAYTLCLLRHRWVYDMDWEPDAHCYNPGSANRLCRRCSRFEWTTPEAVEAAHERGRR